MNVVGSCKSYMAQQYICTYRLTGQHILQPGMSLEAGNQQKSPVTLAVTAGYFFSLKKVMRENLSSISNTTYSACIYWSACLRLQIFTNKHRYISSNPNNISRYFPLIGDEIVDVEGLNYPGYIFSFFF